MKNLNRMGLAALSLTLSTSVAFAATEVTWWHAMGGELGTKLEEIVAGYNASQSDYVVTPVYKGSYAETMTAAIAAFRAGEQPEIVQVFEVGTGTMMAAKGAVYPVYQLMADAKEPFDPKAYIGPVYGYYSTTDGKLLSMPFNSSTPVFYWNKEMLKKAGLDPEKPPTTWPELGEMGKKLIASGAKCGFTPQWQTWTMIENLGAWHNQPFATKQKGQLVAGEVTVIIPFVDPVMVGEFVYHCHIVQHADQGMMANIEVVAPPP